MRKAVVRESNGFVENVIEIEFPTTWQPPEGCYLIDALDASPGDTWDGVKFIRMLLPTTEPPTSTHIATLVAVDASKARPAKVKRIWDSREYLYDCLVTQAVKDEYQAGKIAIGDYVIVHYDDSGEQIVIAKVYKSW